MNVENRASRTPDPDPDPLEKENSTLSLTTSTLFHCVAPASPI